MFDKQINKKKIDEKKCLNKKNVCVSGDVISIIRMYVHLQILHVLIGGDNM